MRYWVFMVLLFTGWPVYAGQVESVIAPMAPMVAGGQPAEVSVFIHNTGTEPVEIRLHRYITCRLVGLDGGGRQMVTAERRQPAADERVVIEGGRFVKVQYAYRAPTALTGPVRLELDAYDAPPALIAIGNPPAGPGPSPASVATETDTAGAPSLDSLFALYQPYLDNLYAYEPMYFLVGTDASKSKFQISFKYQLFNEDNPVANTHPWLQGLHFGYTQTSFWDLASASAPFEDTSYKPEFFFQSQNLAFRPAIMEGMYVRTGVQHESNGRGGAFSRSTNFLYAQPVFVFYDAATRYGLAISPRFWAYVDNDGENNPDIDDFRGYANVDFKFGKADGFVFDTRVGWAREGGSAQFDLTYPLHRITARNVNIYLQAQYVNALAENLLDYRERSEAFRLGLAIVR